MRLLTVIDSLAVGGAERSLAALAPHLVTRGVELHVAFLKQRRGVDDDLERAGAVLHSLEGSGGRRAAIARTTRLIRSVAPNLVHTTLFEGDIIGRTAAWRAGVPVVSSLVTEAYGPEHLENPDFSPWKVRTGQLVDIATARLVTRFHAVSAATKTVMASRLLLPPDKIDVIHRGRDETVLGEPSAERRARTRRDLGIADDLPLVVAAGRHYHYKGLDVLMRAFPEIRRTVPPAHLLIAGREGPASPRLRQLAEEGGFTDSLHLLGQRSDVPDLMCAADVFVLPSRAEGSPGVLIEAMAMGAPIVASDIPSVQEVAGTSPVTVETFPVESAPLAAQAIVRVLTERDHARTLGSTARERFLRSFTMSAIANETMDFYRRSLSDAGSGSISRLPPR